jgi:predicted dehydrogenase
VDPVRLAVIGAGVIGRKHIETIAQADAAELVAIADPDTSAEAIAASYGGTYFGDYGAMLSSARPDGVIVAAPTEKHAGITLDALGSGAHVLIEKPIAASLPEAEQIVAQAKVSGRHVLVGHHRRYYTLVDRAREIVRGGELGRLVALNGQWTTLKPDSYFEPAWRRQRKAGPVLTNLVHELDVLRYICGEITSISAETSGVVRGHEAEETVAILIRFDGGALGTFLLSDVAPSPWTWEFATGENPAFPQHHQNVCRFMGTEAALEFPNLRIWHYGDGERGWNFAMRPQDISVPLGDAFATQCAHFCAVIKGEEPPRVSAEDAMKSLAATLAVFEAMDTGRRVIINAHWF